MRKLAVLLTLVMVFTGCASQGEDSTTGSNPFGVSSGGGGFELTTVSLADVPRASAPEEYKNFFVEDLHGLVPLPMNPATLANDLSVADPTGAGEILNNMVDNFGVLYIDSENPRIVIDYEVYRFNSEDYALRALEAYKRNWNNKRFEKANKTLWVWEGCFVQAQPPMPQGAHIFWDGNLKVASLDSGTAILASMGDNLYCYHGEGAFGEYFVMVDIHAPLSEFPELGEEIFSEYLEKINATQDSLASSGNITQQTVTQSSESTGQSELPAGDRIAVLEKKKEEITKAYLEGKVNLELYTYTLQKIEEELKSINGSAVK